MPDAESTTGLTQRRLLLCMGPGGVGKTTCAAALAAAAAHAGRKVAVLTVDPSRRLAQALGFDDPAQLGHELVEIEIPGSGQLWAGGLDRVRVFDEIVGRCADAQTADRVRGHPIYRATAQRLGGALEYASMARVQMLADADEYELIVVDTPPAANALDFLRAPDRVRQLIENPAARLLSASARRGGAASFTTRIAGVGGGIVSRTLERIGGAGFLGQLSGFLAAFAEVIQEFHRRGTDFGTQLRLPTTGVLLVTSPAPFSVREAGAFLDTLNLEGLHVDGVVLNRVDLAPGNCDELGPDGPDCIDPIGRAACAAAQQSLKARESIRRGHPQVAVIELLRQGAGPTDVASLVEFGQALWTDT